MFKSSKNTVYIASEKIISYHDDLRTAFLNAIDEYESTTDLPIKFVHVSATPKIAAQYKLGKWKVSIEGETKDG